MMKTAGRKPYGHNPAEAEIIARMRRLRNKHHGKRRTYAQIAATLNEEHVPPPAGVKWYATSIKNIVERVIEAEKKTVQKRGIEGTDYLDLKQAAKLWGYLCDDWLATRSKQSFRRKVIIGTMMFAGLRVGEIVKLQMRDLPGWHGHETLTVRNAGRKRKSTSSIAISRTLAAELCIYCDRHCKGLGEKAFVFRNDYGQQFKTDDIRYMVKGAGRKVGITWLHPHCLRHTYASIFMFDNKNQFFLQAQLRHASLATTGIYVNVIRTEITDETSIDIINILRAVNPDRK